MTPRMTVMSVANGDLPFAVLTFVRQILCISIYIELGNIDRTPFGKRATVYKGRADLKEILQTEAAGKHIKRVHETQEEKGKMLVMGKNSCLMEIILSSHSSQYPEPRRSEINCEALYVVI